MPFVNSVLYVLFIGILSHFVGEAVPRSAFHPNRFPYRAYKWEKNGKFYEKIRIRRWKVILPDMSRVMRDMFPKRIPGGSDSTYVSSLAAETCRAEIVHFVLILFAPGIWFYWKNNWGIILSAFYAVCNVPFIFLQRYNRPQLVRLADNLKKREEKRRESSHSVL